MPAIRHEDVTLRTEWDEPGRQWICVGCHAPTHTYLTLGDPLEVGARHVVMQALHHHLDTADPPAEQDETLELICKCGHIWQGLLPCTCPSCGREYGVSRPTPPPQSRWP
jgi:hypothetical protein